MMYRRGPSTEPCGRPYGAGTHRDQVESWTTLKASPWRKEPIHSRKLPDNPNVTFNQFRRKHDVVMSSCILNKRKFDDDDDSMDSYLTVFGQFFHYSDKCKP